MDPAQRMLHLFDGGFLGYSPKLKLRCLLDYLYQHLYRHERDRDTIDEQSAPIARLIHLLISDAIHRRASEFCVEPFGDRVRVQYLVDGMLEECDGPPRRLLAPLVARIKTLASIGDRQPQEGIIKLTYDHAELDLRVSVTPTQDGPSVVIRFPDTNLPY